MINYAFLADATAVTHFTILVVVIIGLLVSFRYKRFRPWEAGIVIVIVVLWSYLGNCPLAILEQYFRDMAGQNVDINGTGFTTYYAEKLFGVDLPSRVIQRTTFFTAGVLFAGSIEALSPFMHMELFKFRKVMRKIFGKKNNRKRYA
ncbi:MAG: DUF2784 family protein [bacterium]|nr:DUF2784 family protein [bacterium]